MLIPVITQYLETHKRLVIPQLGAFIVKEPGRAVLFSELLKRDDGVLRGLLCARGLNELEAAGEIDRFVFEVRHAVEHGLVCPLPGLGEMKGGANGTIAFTYDPRPAVPAAATEPAAAGESAGASASSHDGGEAAAGTDGERDPSRRPQFDAGRMAETMKSAFTEPHVSPSAKMNPDPSVRGLRYGKPPKNTDAYTYVNRVPRRRGDRFIWIAIRPRAARQPPGSRHRPTGRPASVLRLRTRSACAPDRRCGPSYRLYDLNHDRNNKC